MNMKVTEAESFHRIYYEYLKYMDCWNDNLDDMLSNTLQFMQLNSILAISEWSVLFDAMEWF